MAIAASRDLVTLVALEVVSLPAFAMVGLRRDDPRAAEASMKFFLVSVVSTAVMLMGVSLVYGATGSMFLTQVDQALVTGAGPREVAVAGALLTVVGLAFKVAAVPFHMWVPDTYVGAPVAVAAYLSVVSKAAGFVGLMLVLGLGLRDLTGLGAARGGARGADHDRRQRAGARAAARGAAARLVVGGAGRVHAGAVRRGRRGRRGGRAARAARCPRSGTSRSTRS